MGYVNYAVRRYVRITKEPRADIEFLKIYEPQVLYAAGLLMYKMGVTPHGLFFSQCVPDIIYSAYRDKKPKNGTSAHNWAQAIDFKVGKNNDIVALEKQIEWVNFGVLETKLFNRGGLYPTWNTCHLDRCDDKWMKKYRGKKFWSRNPKTGKIIGFNDFENATKYARDCMR